jgi:phosphoserine phosphatase
MTPYPSHIFDMDGTLLRYSTASLEISRRLDHVAELEDFETRFVASEINAADSRWRSASLGTTSPTTLVTDVATRAPWMTLEAELCQLRRARMSQAAES